MKKILLLSITSLAMLMADFTLIGEQLTPVTEPVAETTPTAPTITTGEYTIVPGLYGFGTDTRAAYGGTVDPVILHVDTLTKETVNTDATHGSLRWAIAQTYPRVVVFDVSGVIDWEMGGVSINNPYISILGQTAPGPIVINGGGFFIVTHDVLIQHLAVRNKAGAKTDSISIVSEQREVYNIVIDHCSATWAADEQISVARTKHPCHDITIANSIMGEGIVTHNFGSLNYADNVAHIRNLYTHSYMRNPQFAGESSGAVYNNLVYNWKHSICLFASIGGATGNTVDVSYIGNNAIVGPNSTPSYDPSIHSIKLNSDMAGNTAIIYMEDNIVNGVTTSGYDVLDESGEGYTVRAERVLPNYTPISASETKASVIANVGPRPNSRDAVDARLINEVINGTGSFASVVPTMPAYQKLTQPFIPVTNPHDIYNDHYTNLEYQLHELAAAVER